MARRRFRKDETFSTGQAVEVRNGSHWHGATVTGPLEYDSFGAPFYPARVLKSRGTVLAGDYWPGYPDGIREVAADQATELEEAR